MIAVNTNVLVHARGSETSKHGLALIRFLALAEPSSCRVLPVFCPGGYVRVVTHPRLFNPPHSADEACLALGRLVASPSLPVLCPGRGYPALLTEAVREANAIGNLVFDAQTAALCRGHGVVRLMTEDRDFDRFAGLDTWRLAGRSRAWSAMNAPIRCGGRGDLQQVTVVGFGRS